MAVSCRRPRIREASLLSRITAQCIALRYKCIWPLLLSIKFSTEKVLSIFSIFGVIFKKSMDFFKFKRSIRSFVFFLASFSEVWLSLTTKMYRTFFVEQKILYKNTWTKIKVGVARFKKIDIYLGARSLTLLNTYWEFKIALRTLTVSKWTTQYGCH